jgi:stage VI sporulation protein D
VLSVETLQEQLSKIKFDFYEQFHIENDSKTGISEIEEANLTSVLSTFRDGVNVILNGHLLLGIKYIGTDGNPHEFQYRIPVEITVPVSRLLDTTEIPSQIEKFDVDLIAARQITLSGVFSISVLGVNEE